MNEPAQQLPAHAENMSTRGFNLYIGPLHRLSTDTDGMGARYAFVAEAKHMNGSGTVHGGMLMAFADIAMSRTARAGFEGKGCNTVSLTADFVSPGKLGELIEAHVRVTRRTRSLVFQSAEVRVGERVLMVATGLWKVGR